jgi:hypothetical protein
MCTKHKLHLNSDKSVAEKHILTNKGPVPVSTMFSRVAKRCEKHILHLLNASSDILNHGISLPSNTSTLSPNLKNECENSYKNLVDVNLQYGHNRLSYQCGIDADDCPINNNETKKSFHRPKHFIN